MAQRNNVPIIFKNQIVWTTPQLLSVFKLLVMKEIGSTENPLFTVLVKSSSLVLDFEHAFPEADQLDGVRQLIKQISLKREANDFINLNTLAQELLPILKLTSHQRSDHKVAKDLSKLVDFKPSSLSELFVQVKRLLNEQYIFITDQSITIDDLMGKWISKSVMDIFDFDINFNMTDVSPSQDVTLTIENNSATISVSVIDWITHKTGDLSLIQGERSLSNGVLMIKNPDNSAIFKLPIIKVENGLLDTYMFKTRASFRRVSMI